MSQPLGFSNYSYFKPQPPSLREQQKSLYSTKDPFAYLQDPTFTPRTKQRLQRDHEDELMNYNVKPKNKGGEEMPPIRNSFKRESVENDLSKIKIMFNSPEVTSRQYEIQEGNLSKDSSKINYSKFMKQKPNPLQPNVYKFKDIDNQSHNVAFDQQYGPIGEERIFREKQHRQTKECNRNLNYNNSSSQLRRDNSKERPVQMPTLHIDRITFKNLEAKYEEEVFNVLGKEDKAKSTQVSHAKLPIDKLKGNDGIKTERKMIEEMEDQERIQDFVNKTDSIVKDQSFIIGMKGVRQKQGQSNTSKKPKKTQPSQLSIYQEDLDVKMTKLDKQLDQQLSTIGETFDSAINSQKLHETPQKAGNLLLNMNAINAQQKKVPLVSRSTLNNKKKSQKTGTIAFMSKISAAPQSQHQPFHPYKQPKVNPSEEEKGKIFDESFYVDKLGAVEVMTPKSVPPHVKNRSVLRSQHQIDLQHDLRIASQNQHMIVEDQSQMSEKHLELFRQSISSFPSRLVFNPQKLKLPHDPNQTFTIFPNVQDGIQEEDQNEIDSTDPEEIQKIIAILLDLQQLNNDGESVVSQTISNNFDQFILDKYSQDSMMNFFQQCQKEVVLVLPILQKISNKTLNLQGYVLGTGHCKALGVALQLLNRVLSRVILDNNSIHDENLREIIIGLTQLKDFKSLIYKANEIGLKSLETLKPLLIKTNPNNLEELRLVNCKITSTVTEKLLELLYDRCYLKRLALVNANLTENSIKILVEYLQASKLIELDISWNGLLPQNLMSLIETIGENRQLQYLNISWNNIVEQPNPNTEIQNNGNVLKSMMKKQGSNKDLLRKRQSNVQESIVQHLCKFIRYNKNLLHLDLSHTGLTESMLWALGPSIKRAKSLVSIHLSGNPGVTQNLKETLFERLVCKQIDKTYLGIQNIFDNQVKTQILNSSPRVSQLQEGVQLRQVFQQKKQLMTTMNHVQVDSEDKKLIFTRHIGHKFDIPFSGQWEMLTEALHDPCWVCDQWIYTLVFWSQSIGYKSQIEIDILEKEKISNQIKKFNEEDSTIENEEKFPFICGSFTNWKYKKLIPVQTYCGMIDLDKPNLIAKMKEKRACRIAVNKYEDLNAKEKFNYHEYQREYEETVYKKDYKRFIQIYIKYRKPFLANAQYLDKMPPQDQLYVLPIFMKAGKHSYVVQCNDQGQEQFIHKLITPFREEEIPVQVKQSKIKITQRVFKKETSVFKDWKEDTPQIIQKCAEYDSRFWKVPRFVKDPLEQSRCWDAIFENFKTLKDLFITLAARSQFPNISWIDFTTFCESCKIVDKNVVLATIDRLFIATNVEIDQASENPDNALCRYEFFEILVRLGHVKFKEPGICPNDSESLKKLIKENILPNAQIHPWQEFRDKELWTIEVNDVLEANLEGLKKIYSHYFEPRKKYMTMNDALNFMMKDTPLDFIEKEAIFCYGLCKMTVFNELEDSSTKYKRLQFVEFLELIGRIADWKYNEDKIPLHQKIEFVLDEVLKMVEMKRREVVIKVDEQSESDDEY